MRWKLLPCVDKRNVSQHVLKVMFEEDRMLQPHFNIFWTCFTWVQVNLSPPSAFLRDGVPEDSELLHNMPTRPEEQYILILLAILLQPTFSLKHVQRISVTGRESKTEKGNMG